MAMAQDLNVVFYVEQSLFRGGQLIVARKEVSRESLGMPAEKRPPRTEGLAEEVVRAGCLRSAMRRRGPISRVLRPVLAPEIGIAQRHL
jgi:hypothetical protein